MRYTGWCQHDFNVQGHRDPLDTGDQTHEESEDLQGCSVRKGELETPNHSIFLIKRVSSCPFLAESPCTPRLERIGPRLGGRLAGKRHKSLVIFCGREVRKTPNALRKTAEGGAVTPQW
jgi:hypothetical protein